MLCPYCGQDMNRGYIQNPHEINWKPNKAKLFGAAEFHEGAIVLSEMSFFKGSCIEAHCCKNCKKNCH